MICSVDACCSGLYTPCLLSLSWITAWQPLLPIQPYLHSHWFCSPQTPAVTARLTQTQEARLQSGFDESPNHLSGHHHLRPSSSIHTNSGEPVGHSGFGPRLENTESVSPTGCNHVVSSGYCQGILRFSLPNPCPLLWALPLYNLTYPHLRLLSKKGRFRHKRCNSISPHCVSLALQ